MGLISSIIEGFINSNYNNSNFPPFDQNRWNALIDKINASMDEENFSKADSQLGNYYRQYEPEKDYHYYWFRTCITVRWLESSQIDLRSFETPRIVNRAKDCIRNALKLSSNEEQTTQVMEMQERLEAFQSELEDFNQSMALWKEVIEKYDALVEEDKFSAALSELERYYDTTGEEYDWAYYSRAFYMKLRIFDQMSVDDPHYEDLMNELESMIEPYRQLCTADEDIHDFDDLTKFYHGVRMSKLIDKYTSQDAYEQALDVVEWYKTVEPTLLINYLSNRCLVLQRQWRATPVNSKEYSKLEKAVIDAYKVWGDSCKTEEEKQAHTDIYNTAFLSIKAEKDAMKLAQSQNEVAIIDNDESPEVLYKQEVLLILQDGSIGDVERKFLERKRTKLGLTKEQAQKIEASCTVSLTDEEQEYVSIYRDLVEDGEPTGRLRKMLDREADALGIAPERISEIEKML